MLLNYLTVLAFHVLQYSSPSSTNRALYGTFFISFIRVGDERLVLGKAEAVGLVSEALGVSAQLGGSPGVEGD